MRVRRRRFFLLRVADDPTLDIKAFLSGEIVLRAETRCSLLCPIRGESLPLTVAELALVMGVPADRWVTEEELDPPTDGASTRIAELVRRGILLSDPPSARWEDLASAEQVLEQAQWLDVAAVYHAHSRWDGVVGVNVRPKHGDDAQPTRLEELRRSRGDPPPHFIVRTDARERIGLRTPALGGPFFDTLLARRTTRAFRSDEPLPLAALEHMLYAVFGTHGIKHFAPRVTAIKRTSPSGGALHPIEAYVLAINVERVPAGLYHYETGSHALAELERMDTPSARDLASTFTAGQTYFAEAHALVVHVARFDRNFWKYARHRKAYKSVLMDSGHLSQTFYLTATHLGLGAFYTAAINDADISRRLRLAPGREAAIAINGVGIAISGRDELHFMPDRYEPHSVV